MNHSKPLSEKQSRRTAYKLRATSQSILRRGHRVHVCQKLPSYAVQNGMGSVGLSRNEHGKAHFHGFATCGDVHACPVCREKIGEIRVKEILHVLSWHRSNNNGIALLATFTARHHKGDSLSFMVSGMSEAKRYFSSLTSVKKIKSLLSYQNMISGRDLTYGDEHGWHNHYHDIWLIAGGVFRASYFRSLPEKLQAFAFDNGLLTKAGALSILSIQRKLAQIWADCCRKAGVKVPTIRRGFQLDWRKDGTDAVGAYVAKWARELGTTHKKEGRNGSLTPFQILSGLSKQFDLEKAKLWIEYTDAFYGKSLVFFGRGLKQASGLKDLSDEEIAEGQLKEHICDFTKDEYQAIVVYSAYQVVLDLADKYPKEFVIAYVRSLVERRTKENVDYTLYMRNLRASINEYTEAHLRELAITLVA